MNNGQTRIPIVINIVSYDDGSNDDSWSLTDLTPQHSEEGNNNG